MSMASEMLLECGIDHEDLFDAALLLLCTCSDRDIDELCRLIIKTAKSLSMPTK